MAKDAQLTVILSVRDYQRVTAAAKAEDRTRSGWARRILEAELDRLDQQGDPF